MNSNFKERIHSSLCGATLANYTTILVLMVLFGCNPGFASRHYLFQVMGRSDSTLTELALSGFQCTGTSLEIEKRPLKGKENLIGQKAI